MDIMTIDYIFKMTDVVKIDFHLKFDTQKFELIENIPEKLPGWAKLDFHQCPHCPLQKDAHSYCPLAANMVNIVTRFDQFLPYAETHLTVITKERVISQNTTVQAGVGSLMGLVMATSGCPHAAFFKPMARFHLPLASTEETIYRSISMYLMAQYFLNKEGKGLDLNLKGLNQVYENMHTVNAAVAERFLAASKTDSSIDAVVQLDIYAMTFLGIPEEPLEDIRYLFEAFFGKK